MELLGVRLEPPANYPVMLLREKDGQQRLLPVYIGGPEAAAISYVLEGVETPRPLTHDLLKNVLGELNANLTNVVITELREHTFYAELHLKTGNGDRVISSRPSDAVGARAAHRQPDLRERGGVGGGGADARRRGGAVPGDPRGVPGLHRTRQPGRLRRQLTARARAPSITSP